MPADESVEQRLDGVELGIGQIANLSWQAARQCGQQITRPQNLRKGANVFDGMRSADLPDQATQQLVILDGRRQHCGDTLSNQILKIPRRTLVVGSSATLSRQARDCDRIAGSRLDREITTDPGPDRRNRGACDPALMLSFRPIIDQKRLDRAGWTISRDAWRTSCNRKSPPGTSSPRSKALSSFVFSKARVSGANCRRYCRNRSTGRP
jgi:hypothetical protein